MPQLGPPTPPSNGDALAYQRRLDHLVLRPYVRQIEAGVAQAGRDYTAIRIAIQRIPSDPALATMAPAAARAHIRALEVKHRKDFTRKMSRSLGVNVGPLMTNLGVEGIMRQAIADNVALIKTIPPRLHSKLTADMAQWATETPFDEQELRRVLSTGYRSAGYNLRRIARDQTSKTIGKFAQARQEQVGVKEYVWSTSGDERVRPTHVANDGETFAWDAPPPETGHPGEDILCRCTALPVLDGVRPRGKAAKPAIAKPRAKPKPPIPSPPKRPETGAQAREAVLGSDEVALAAKLDEELQALSRLPDDLHGEGYWEWRKTVKAKKSERTRLMAQIREKHLYHSAPKPTLNAKITAGAKKNPASTIGVDAVERMVVNLDGVEVGLQLGTTRANARRVYRNTPAPSSVGEGLYPPSLELRSHGALIKISKESGANTVVHEVGHAIEFSRFERKLAARNHLLSRTEGERARSLRSLTGKNYAGHEQAKPDEFLESYVGKIYPDGDTEVISMGLEMMFKDPIRLAKEDPRLFDFIFDDVMRWTPT